MPIHITETKTIENTWIKNNFKYYIGLFIFLISLDTISTTIGVLIHKLPEHNPIIRYLLTSPEPVLWLILYKTTGLIIIYHLLNKNKNKHPTFTKIFLISINILYAIVVVLNTITIVFFT